MFTAKFIEKFWARVDKSGGDNACWSWTGALYRNGYGSVYLRPKLYLRTRRVAYELTHGEIPDGLYICHRCDNPPCCNPAHLFAGTAKDNFEDMVKKGRSTVFGDLAFLTDWSISV